mgnify:CR=1 FL=1
MILLQQIELYPVNILQIVFAFTAAFGALLIWNQDRYRGLANFFIYLAALMLLNLLEETQVTREFYLITPIFTLLHGPLIYFFIRTLVNDKSLSTIPSYSHFIAMFLALPFTEHVQQVVAVGTVSQIIYLVISFQLLRRYHVASMAMRSDADSLTLTWVFKILTIFTIFAFVDLVRLNLQTENSIMVSASWYFFDLLIFFSISCFLLYKAFRQPILFDGMTSYEESEKHPVKSNEQSDIDTAKSVFDDIENIILRDKLYNKPRLSITDISNQTGLNIKDISWAINLGCNRNFCEYINGLRVKEVQQKILDDQQNSTPLLNLAYESGFNSKSTFNAVFKNEVGMTPTQFLRSNHSH